MAPVLKANMPALKGAEGNKGATSQILKLVALALADSANEDGTDSHPGVRSIAETAQCHTATAVRALRHLVDLGAITQTEPGGPRRKAVYTVHAEWFVARVGREKDRRTLPALRAPDAQEECASQTRAARAPQTRSSARPRGAHLRPVPSVTPAPGAVDDAWFECIHRGCFSLVDPRQHRTRCEEHDVARRAEG